MRTLEMDGLDCIIIASPFCFVSRTSARDASRNYSGIGSLVSTKFCLNYLESPLD